jgi:VWFA-related protein
MHQVVSRHAVTLGLLLAAVGAPLVAGRQAPAPQAPPSVTFRAEASSVEVDAVVTDAQGRSVTDLERADFEVLEDGRPQRIETFSLVRLPLERPARPLIAGAPVEPDVAANTAAAGRIYLLVLDDLHTSVANTPRVKAFLRDFLERGFGDNDLASVAYTSGRIAASQEFTNNRRLLLDAIEKFSGQRLRSEAIEIGEALNRDPRDPDDTPINPRNQGGDGRDPFDPYSRLNPFEAERAYQARATMTVVRELSTLMESVRGRRKSMLLVSEGLSYNIYDGFRNTSAGVILREAREAMGAAMRANVAIYPIDPRGLAGVGDAIEAPGTSPNDPHFSVPGTMLNLLRLSQQSLRVLAEQTGGFAGIDQNDLAGVFDRLVQENSTYYLFGYSPPNDRADGRFRRIEVRVRRPGVQVRARPGYVAAQRRPDARAAKAGPLDAALRSPVPVTGIPLVVSAAAYRGAAQNATVALSIEMRADQFRLSEKNGRLEDRLRVGLSPVDASGAPRGAREHVLDLDLRPDTAALVRDRGLRVVSMLTLPPGRYHLRVAAAEEGANRTGSVFYDLEVPDFRAPGLHISGIALTASGALDDVTVRAEDPFAGILLGPPVAARAFTRADVIALLAEVYENGVTDAPPHVIDVSAVVRAADGRVVFENREERSSSARASGAHRYGVQIPLDGLQPGRYVITVEGRLRGPGGAAARRDVVIEVR